MTTKLSSPRPRFPAAAAAAAAGSGDGGRQKGSGGGESMPPPPPPVVDTHWRSIYVASFLYYVSMVQFTLYFSSIWPYLQVIDRSITETQFGWIIAIYSVGQIVAAPLFGWWSNRLGRVRPPIFVGLGLMLLGNLCYLCLETSAVPPEKLWLLLAGRFVNGMGSAIASLFRNYAATGSTAKDRSRAIAFVTCGQALGGMGGPVFQLLFVSFAYPGPGLLGVRFNLYTAPAFLASGMNIFGMLILWLLFNEQYAGLEMELELEEKKEVELVEEGMKTPKNIEITPVDKERRSSKTAATDVSPEADGGADGVKQPPPLPTLPPYDLIACSLCYLARFTQMFTQTNLETIGSPLAMTMFGWNESTAVERTSIPQGLVGVIALTICVFYITVNSVKGANLHFRLSCMLSLVSLAAFHLLRLTFSWPGLGPPVPTYNESQRIAYQLSHTAPEPVGCNMDKFTWCQTLSQVNVWLYYGAYVVLVGLAFSVLHIALNTLFSHVLGPRQQGTEQGLFQVAGSVARLLGPILMSNLYTTYGPRMAWTMELVVVGGTLLLWAGCYRRMVPLLRRRSPKKRVVPAAH